MANTQSAKLNYLKIAPRKMRLIASAIRGLSVSEAEAQLLLSPKRASMPLVKLLHSAVSNAKNNQKLNTDRLFIKEIRVDQGPTLKRFMPRAMGRATPIQKKSSHITLVLGESDKLKEPRFKIKKIEKISRKKAEAMRAARVRETEKQDRRERETEKVRHETQKPKPTTGPGFIKRMFRRKSI